MSNRIDFKNEFLWLYELQKQRVKKLRDAELKSGGAPLPDTTQNIDLLLKILVQIVNRSTEEVDMALEKCYEGLLESLKSEKQENIERSKSRKHCKPSNMNEERENIMKWEDENNE